MYVNIRVIITMIVKLISVSKKGDRIGNFRNFIFYLPERMFGLIAISFVGIMPNVMEFVVKFILDSSWLSIHCMAYQKRK